jgi:hypothetical protein
MARAVVTALGLAETATLPAALAEALAEAGGEVNGPGFGFELPPHPASTALAVASVIRTLMLRRVEGTAGK